MISLLRSVYHYFLAWLGNLLYGFPSRKIFVIGITGTKGKSTVVELINVILEKAGKKTALLSSIRMKIGDDSQKNLTGMTMPGRFALQRFLRKAVSAHSDYAIIEVTSQGSVQHRHRFIEWNAAMFLNLTPEHIESHGGFENYRAAKVSFFKYVATHRRGSGQEKSKKYFFINESDDDSPYFSEAAGDSGEIIRFSRENFIRKELNNGKESIGDWLSSNFNLENAAAASALAESQGISWPAIKQTLASFKGLPGRMETIQEKPFRVVVDYAHTPDSLLKIYQAFGKAKLICVLGAAGGGRDKWKRPEMGKIASSYCREIILTNEDPFDESPLEIIGQIKSGISSLAIPEANVTEVLDRKEAIRMAIGLAKKGDTVIITGKGSEAWLRVENGKKIPWNEREIVEQLLREK